MTAAQPVAYPTGATVRDNHPGGAGGYHDATEVSPVSLVVPQHQGPTGEDFPGPPGPSCADPTAPPPNEWTPTVEATVVPDKLWAICSDCPLRDPCLTKAIAGTETGYWAGTTTTDRETLAANGPPNITAADTLRRIRAQHLRSPVHTPGMGNTYWYSKRSCRCHECTAANTAARARSRARARLATTVTKGTDHAPTHSAPPVSRLA